MMQAPEESPRVSIIIPCYNHFDYLRECLASVVAQTFRQWEAIVVDDASTEGDPTEVVDSFGDTRMRTLRLEKNVGMGLARNRGIGDTRCDLLLPLDSDDKLDPRFLEVTMALLETDPRADCVFTDFSLFGAEEGTWRYRVKTASDMLSRQWIPGPGTLMRRRVWESVGGYGGTRAGNEDWDFWIRAVQHDLRPLNVPESLYLYRRGHNSMSVENMVHEYATRETIYRSQFPFFKQHATGGYFLAEGYYRSARAFAARGERLRAAYLFGRYAALWPKRVLDWKTRRERNARGETS